MQYIHRPETEPYFNVAAEEYILKNYEGDICSLWRNEECIVVGKHQNALAEVNAGTVRKNGLKVIRRISGGGTVYQDPGNINFTFIASGEEGRLVDFRKFLDPVAAVLREMGVDVTFSGRNDLMIGDRKISGNAEHIFRNRVIHHGTLLFDADLEKLHEALKTNAKYTDKSVQSVRKPVANLRDHLPERIDPVEMIGLLREKLQPHLGITSITEFSDSDRESIHAMVKDKYSTWEWNFGYSPNYIFHNMHSWEGVPVQVELSVKKGIITDAAILCGNRQDECTSLAEQLTGRRHFWADLEEIMDKIETDDWFRANCMSLFF